MKISLIAAFVMIALMMSCVTDLDVKPNDPFIVTSDNVYTTTESYKQGLAKLYATISLTGQKGPVGAQDVGGVDEGFSCFIRSVWYLNELTTDEAVWSYPTDANGTIFNLHYNSWTPSDGIPTALFARILNVAALTGEFIRATNGKTGDSEIKKFQAEARFLRALAYYHGLDLFANIPFITEKDLPGSYFPPQKKRAELFTYVESELKAIKADLGAPRFEYGRADKAACAMLLAKLYLNAEVYIKQPKYTEAITELKEVIAAGYVLSPKYANLFRADNDKNNSEIIFSQTYDGKSSQAYSIINVLVKGYSGVLTKNGEPQSGWAGTRTTSVFLGKFSTLNESRAILGTTYLDDKTIKDRTIEIDAINDKNQGYGLLKFRNITSSGATPLNDDTGFEDTDFPMFRLADAYLMYAEAVLRGGTGGDLPTGLSYVNAIRTRSGDVAAGNAPGAVGSIDLDFILDERARELYWEAHRRQDLIRFGKFTGDSYVWPWKGGIKAGTSIEAKRAIFPIPATDIGSNPNLKQNDGY